MKTYLVASMVLASLSGGVAYKATRGESTPAESAPPAIAAPVRPEAPPDPAPLPIRVRPATTPPASRQMAPVPEPTSKSSAPSTVQLPPDADVRVQMATLSREQVARREEELSGVLGRLSKALSGIGGPDDWESHEMAMEEFQKLVTLQRKMASEVLAGYEQFRSAMAAYRKDLDRAPEAYRQAATYFKERAIAEDNEFFKKNYMLLSDNCHAYARLVQSRRAELERFLTDVAETVAFVEKTAAFLKDFEDFVRLTPGLDTSAARREFRQQLKEYVKAFSAFQDRFIEFSRKLKERAFSDGLSLEHSRTLKLEQDAHSLLEEYGFQVADSKAKWAAVKEQWPAFVAAGRHDEAEKARNAAIYDHAERVTKHYREAKLQSVRGTKAILEAPDALEPGSVFPYMRSSRTYAGAAIIRAKVGNGRYEVEPLVGTFTESDILVFKL